jgi:hypothetical protein
MYYTRRLPHEPNLQLQTRQIPRSTILSVEIPRFKSCAAVWTSLLTLLRLELSCHADSHVWSAAANAARTCVTTLLYVDSDVSTQDR